MLILKHQGANEIEQLTPIALANFKHKIITKILAGRLVKVLPYIISQEQKAFIYGRSIRDHMLLTPMVANLMHEKTYGGNIAKKVDISKAFETLK